MSFEAHWEQMKDLLQEENMILLTDEQEKENHERSRPPIRRDLKYLERPFRRVKKNESSNVNCTNNRKTKFILEYVQVFQDKIVNIIKSLAIVAYLRMNLPGCFWESSFVAHGNHPGAVWCFAVDQRKT